MPATFGAQTISASAVIGESGAPIRVVSAQVTSDGVAASVLTLRNGTSGSGTIYWQGTGVISQTTAPVTFPAGGLYFPGGLFVSLDAHGTGAIIEYEQVATI